MKHNKIKTLQTPCNGLDIKTIFLLREIII